MQLQAADHVDRATRLAPGGYLPPCPLERTATSGAGAVGGRPATRPAPARVVDEAERLVRAAKRRGAPSLTPDERKLLDYWLKERDELERRALEAAEQPLCDTCPLRGLNNSRNHGKQQQT
jgi:hypothetical protein